MLLWNTSGVDESPKGNLQNLHLRNGVMNVVKAFDPLSGGICQNP